MDRLAGFPATQTDVKNNGAQSDRKDNIKMDTVCKKFA
jgi:hypothetical protein